MSPILHSVHDVSQRLSVGTRTVWRWIAEGTLRAYKLGGRTVIKDVDLAAFLTNELKEVSRVEN